jgi:hypothetical protein
MTVEAIPFAPIAGARVCTKFGTEYHQHCKGCNLRIKCVDKYLKKQGVKV